MNKLSHIVKILSVRKKKLFIFLLITLIMGVIFGSIFVTLLNENDKAKVLNDVTSFFGYIKQNKMNSMDVFISSIKSNFLFIAFIWLLGISIIGIPLIVSLVFFKGFILGFSIGSIILKYKLLGILGSLSYVFPHIIISTILILIMSYYALYLSISLFTSVFNKQTINFKNVIGRYNLIMLLCIVISLVGSTFEAFVSPHFIRLFLKL